MIKAHVSISRLSLNSPIDGPVQALSVTTRGQVVTVGELLMRIVPTDRVSTLSAFFPIRDAGFVAVGQHVAMKLKAFPFTRCGTIDATVTQVASDAILEPIASLD